jgi:23S rRNA pseudouridine1911/1915/1917 synthase
VKRQIWEVTSAEEGMPLCDFLSSRLGSSREAADEWVTRGAIYVQGRRAQRPLDSLRSGQKVMAVLEERGQGDASSGEPRALWREIGLLHEDDWVLVISKPAGLVSQPTQGRSGHSLWDWARDRAGVEVGLVHRLDRETSGVVVLGKHRQATAALTAQFAAREARKRYLAVVAAGFPESGRIALPISKDRSRIGRRIARAGAGESGFPIAGDRLYEGPHLKTENFSSDRCMLHASELAVRHPGSGQMVSWTAPVPRDFARFVEAVSAPR